MVIVINSVIGGFSWVDLVWMPASTVRFQVSNYSKLSDYTVRLHCPITLSDYNCTKWLVKYNVADAPITFWEIVMVMIIIVRISLIVVNHLLFKWGKQKQVHLKIICDLTCHSYQTDTSFFKEISWWQTIYVTNCVTWAYSHRVTAQPVHQGVNELPFQTLHEDGLEAITSQRSPTNLNPAFVSKTWNFQRPVFVCLFRFLAKYFFVNVDLFFLFLSPTPRAS